MGKTNGFIWTPKLWDINKIKPTPNNFKIKTPEGEARLAHSMEKYGNAGTVTVNFDGTLINGNSRLKEEKAKGTKKLWAMTPNRQMSPKEFTEFAAMFDFASAGEVDTERIKKELGTSKDFFKRWGMEMPLEILDIMGAKSSVEKTNGKQSKEVDALEPSDETLVPFNMFFTYKQEKKFKEWYPTLSTKMKTQSVTDTVFKIIEEKAKSLKLK